MTVHPPPGPASEDSMLSKEVACFDAAYAAGWKAERHDKNGWYRRFALPLRTCMKTLRFADNRWHERNPIPDGPYG